MATIKREQTRATMEAINALHNKLQSLEEELSNVQQHSHQIDGEVIFGS